MAGVIIGAVAGVALAWLIQLFKSRFTWHGGAVGSFQGIGCVASLVMFIVFGAIGAAIGGAIGAAMG